QARRVLRYCARGAWEWIVGARPTIYTCGGKTVHLDEGGPLMVGIRSCSTFLRAPLFLAVFLQPFISPPRPLSIQLEGTVTGFRTDEPLLDPFTGFAVGQHVVGSYIYDNAAHGVGDAHSEGYFNAVSHAEVQVGSYFASSTLGEIDIANDYGASVF